ncbi:MAG: hypothetical protein K2Z25_19325 [Beijerinckiaceae bacterium]|nr:hypothetical protein [Beijerinckiaceae bacterium]
MADTPDYRFETANDHIYDMTEQHRRWEVLDDLDDPHVVAEMIADGDVEIDPTGSLIRMTKHGLACAAHRSQDWDDHHFPTQFQTMTVRQYAKHRGVPPGVIEAACKDRIAFAMWGGKIDVEVADKLWPNNPGAKDD